jgi:hypothetical protein
MQCAGQQPNQTGFWFSLPNKRQKHVMMVRPYPTFFHPQQPKVPIFITTSLCPTTDKRLFQKQNKDLTDNHNTQPIYIYHKTNF